jgi:diguanylate cyclase (GGDEF)-like protein
LSGAAVQTWLPALQPDGATLQRLRTRRILRDIELELPGAAGTASRWCLLTVRAVEYEGRSCAFAAGTDITVRKEAELELSMLNAQRGRIIDEVEHLQAKLRDVSLRDPLTGLFNRRYLDATLSRELTRCLREGRPLALLVVDADHFKRVNDTFGHAGGDEVLRAIAQILQSTLRSEDVVCRYGGEEFVAVMPGADLALAAARAEALRACIEATPIATDSGLVRITVSIGAGLAEPDDTPVSAFKRADEAVYRAKQSGRNRVACAGLPDPLLSDLHPGS